MKNYQNLQQHYLVNTYVNRQLTLVRGEGVFLFAENGEKYLDLMSNYGVNILGYNHPVVTKALINQLKKITTLHSSFANDQRALASEALIKRCGQNYSHIYWSNSGTEAIEAALKFAVLASNKKKFIVCDHGYHGKTLGALSATAGEKYKKPFEPLLWEFISIPFNDIKALESVIDKNIAGFIVEPIQGEGGIYAPDGEYLKKVKELCSKNEALLIIDEVQTGMGRTGKFLASENIAGDILCLGKGLAGGIPVGATLVNKKIAACVPKHIHTSTFGGNPLSCAGAITTLSLLDNKLLMHVRDTGKYFLKKLSSLQSELIIEARGQGFMLGLVVKDKRSKILQLFQNEHILAIPAGEDVIRLLPPLILQKEHIDIAIKKIQKVFDSLS